MKKALVVDDAIFIRESLRRALEAESFDVYEAEDGFDAVKEYKKIHPDLVTMDITMPGKSGLEAIEEIMEYDPNARIVVITSLGTEFMIRDAIQLGAFNFIIKPFDDDTIAGVLKNML